MNTATEEQPKSSYDLAAGMLMSDWQLAAVALAIMSLPRLVESVSGAYLFDSSYLSSLASRILELGFLALLTQRWLAALSIQQRFSYSHGSMAKVVLVGIAAWSVFYAVMASPFDASQTTLSFVALAVVGIGFGLLFRHAFIFMALVLPISLREQLSLARTYTGANGLLVLKLIFPPFALAALLNVLVESFSPDGRHQFVPLAQSFSSGLFWVLCCFNLVAAGLIHLPDAEWHRLSLDPYRKARLTTIALNGSRWLANLLAPGKARWTLLVAALVFGGNFMRLMSLPPAPQLAVEKVRPAGENELEVTLRVEDPAYQMRGFHPLFFALGGDRRAIVSKMPERAWLDDPARDVRFGLPRQPRASLTLLFETSRPAKELSSLQDLHLWYRNVRLSRIEVPAEPLATPAPAP